MSRRGIRVFFGTVGLLLVGLLVLMYTSFNGNPIRVHLTKAQITSYLREKYPNVTFSEVSSHYNFKFGTYDGWATAHLDPTVRVRIDQHRKGQFTDNLVEAKLTSQARNELLPVAQSLLPSLKDTSIWVSWDRDKIEYKLEVNYSKNLAVEVAMDVRWRGAPMSKEEFIEAALAFSRGMEELGYSNVRRYFFCYDADDYTYALSYGLEERALNKAMLLERVSQWKSDLNTTAPTPRNP